MKDLISNCFLCGERGLHVAGTEEAQVMQCINCGYTTTTKYIGTKDTNEEFQKLTEDMKNWAVEKNNRIWIPSIITLPIGMVFPVADEGSDGKSMKWGFAPMIEIPEDEQSNFPIEGKDGEFHTQKYDTDNSEIFDEFISALSKMNELAKYLGNK